MAKARMRAGLVTGCLVFLAATATAGAAPTVAQMLSFRPKQDIVCSTPTADEQAKCTVELVKAARGSGWMLKSPTGEPLRRYMDTNGDNNIDVWSYYYRGVEVYREIDSRYTGKVDQYRWFHHAGARWGIDSTGDGKIKSWKVISPEEVSQEALQALIKRDYARLQALMLTEAELKTLDLPAPEADRIRDILRKSQARFQESVSKLTGMNANIRWDHLELALPQCVPGDTNNMHQDLIRYTSALVFYQTGDETKGPIEAKGLQLGELIQVGSAWRLIDAPVPGSLVRSDLPGGDTGSVINKEMEGLFRELGDLDKTAPQGNPNQAELYGYNLKRSNILDKMIALADKLGAKEVKPEDREQWVRQVADCLAVAAQNSPASDKSVYQRLVALRDKVAKDQPGGNLAGYVTYCEVMTDYNVRSSKANGDEANKVQKDLLDKLAKFVQDYPKAENTPDSLMQLAMISELMNEEGQAKKWYEMFCKNYSTHPQAGKMKGAWDRLELNGKDLALAGATLTSGARFDVKSLHGKVVVVYYWASWNGQCAGDMEKLKNLLTVYAAKGLEVVCVNLDNTPAEAKNFVQGKQAPSTQLYEQGGMTGKLGEQYGIMVLPTMFLVGKDGKVINHAEQMTTVEDNVKKALN
jgi:thiol-disulfide isomerase/thioredoxin